MVTLISNTNESFIVRWDAVNDIFPINYYTIRWYGENGNNGTANVTTGLSYTVTGLTASTSYTVTVAASNTCCGQGPVSNTMMVTTTATPTSNGTNPMYLIAVDTYVGIAFW